MPKQTPSQTVGPYFAYGLTPMGYGKPGIASHRIADDTVPGQHIVVTGRVLDGKGEPISDGMLEVWQADAQGRLAHPADGRTADFHGFGRAGTDDKGEYRFETVKPGRRHTLIATREDTPGATLYRLDLRLQGEEETVFFDA